MAVALSVVVVCISFAYTAILTQTKAVDVNLCFYFLVTEDMRVDASAVFIKLEGGAGYLLRDEGKEYVVLSVYLEENDGRMVREALARQGKSTQIISVGIKTIYLKLAKDKEKSNVYMGAFQCLRGYAKALAEIILYLDSGGTQEACKRVLQPLIRQMLFLSEEYMEGYPAFSRVCRTTANSLAEIYNGTIYVRDLRYLLCELAEKSVSLALRFSL